MKWKTAIILCLILFTSISTIAISLNTPKPNLQESSQSLLDPDPLPQTPTGGDPVGGGGGPH